MPDNAVVILRNPRREGVGIDQEASEIGRQVRRVAVQSVDCLRYSTALGNVSVGSTANTHGHMIATSGRRRRSGSARSGPTLS
jgi:hypothetical protein